MRNVRHKGKIGIFFCTVFLCIFVVSKWEQHNSLEEETMLRQALRSATIQEYALVGRYPANLEEIQEHYGIFIDEEKFVVEYEVFAQNQMPMILVKRRGVQP